MKLTPVKNKIIQVGRKLCQKNYISGSEGNISYRLSETEILMTVSGKQKGELTTEDIIRVDYEGISHHSSLKASTELKIHLEYYLQRPDVNAVIHAHPVNCIALMLAGIELNKPYLPELVVVLGAVPTAAYGTPSTDEVPESIRQLVGETDAIMLDHHGVVVAGHSLNDALVKLETLEHVAASVIKAATVTGGKPRLLSEQDVEKLIRLRESEYKLTGRFLDNYKFEN